MKQAVTKMVQECCKWISEGTLPSKDVELELISTLRTVTEGKIYVEVERARMTHRLSKMKEEEGEVEEASKIMQELQVETYGSMDRKEKVNDIHFWSKSKIALNNKDRIVEKEVCLFKGDYNLVMPKTSKGYIYSRMFTVLPIFVQELFWARN